MNTPPIREQLLSQVQILIRQRGYNGFSYRDLAERVGIEAASIDQYFSSKEDLLIEAIGSYAAEHVCLMQHIDSALPAIERLSRYAAMFDATPPDQVSLCGMLGADFGSLPERVVGAVRSFYRLHETWLANVVADGQSDGTLEWPADPEAGGRYLFSAFQGALLSSRLFDMPSRIQDVVATVRADPDSN